MRSGVLYFGLSYQLQYRLSQTILSFANNIVFRQMSRTETGWSYEDKRALFCLDYFASNLTWNVRSEILNEYFKTMCRPSRTQSAQQLELSSIRRDQALYLNVSSQSFLAYRFIDKPIVFTRGYSRIAPNSTRNFGATVHTPIQNASLPECYGVESAGERVVIYI